MNPKLSVEIGADVKGLEAALTRADNLLKQHEGNYKRVQSAIGANTQKTLQLEKGLSQLNNELKKGNISQADYSKQSDRLSAELREVNKETSDYQRELRRLDSEMDRVAQSASSYQSAVANTSRTTDTATQAVGAFGKTAKDQAVPAMMSLSQVVQDAPYGIRGVANNIQQLTAQLGYLSAAAGGGAGALKAMVASLAGPAGILMGVSLVTSALVTYGDKIFDAVGATNKLKEATEDYVGEAMAEVSSLKVLLAIANNHEASIVARRKALQEINDKYGDYLGNLTLEELQTDKTRAAVENLTRALIQQAQVKGLKDVIGEETAKAAEKTTQLQLKQRDLYKQIQSELKKMDQTGYWGTIIQDSDDVIGSLALISKTGEKVPAGLATAVGGLKEVGKELREVEAGAAAAIKPYQELQQALQEQIFSVTAVPEFSQDEIVIDGKKPDPIKIPVTFDYEAENLLNPEEVAALGEEISNDLILPTALNTAAYESALNEAWTSAEESLDAHNAAMLEKYTVGAEQNAMFANLVGQGFANLSNQMVDSLLAGEFSLESFGKSVISTFAKIANQMIAQAIIEKIIGKTQIAADHGVAMGNAGVMASSAAAAMGPAGIFAFPGLLAAAGGMVSGFFGSLQAFADGGVVNGSSFHGDKILARVNSGELILNKDQQRNLYSQLQAPGAVGMTPAEPIQLGGYIDAHGDILRVVLDRADKRRGRAS